MRSTNRYKIEETMQRWGISTLVCKCRIGPCGASRDQGSLHPNKGWRDFHYEVEIEAGRIWWFGRWMARQVWDRGGDRAPIKISISVLSSSSTFPYTQGDTKLLFFRCRSRSM